MTSSSSRFRAAKFRSICLLGSLGILPSCDNDPVSPRQSLRFAPETPTLFPATSIKLDLSDADPTARITWTTSAPQIVTVDSTGLIAGVAPGNATIRASTGDAYAETTVTIVPGGGTIRTSRATTCAIATSNELYCWGLNGVAQAGNGAISFSLPVPTRTLGGHAFLSVSPGWDHTCGITATGAFCWGYDPYGALGLGDTTIATNVHRLQPAPVVNGSGFVAIEASGASTFTGPGGCPDGTCTAHTCALDGSGAMSCWGSSVAGSVPSIVPRPVPTTKRFRSISLGMDAVCAIDIEYLAYCWGVYGIGGTLMNDGTLPAVPGGLRFRTISTGRSHACGITLDGDAYCWGANWSGQLGAPSDNTCSFTPVTSAEIVTFPCRNTPAKVSGGYKFLAIAAASGLPNMEQLPASHSCGITVAQTIVCWGEGRWGRLGNGGEATSQAPVAVASDLKFRAVTAGQQHTCALTNEGAAYCWGYNNQFELGNNPQRGPGDEILRSLLPTAVAGNLTFR